jgi:hypothetical protein
MEGILLVKRKDHATLSKPLFNFCDKKGTSVAVIGEELI